MTNVQEMTEEERAFFSEDNKVPSAWWKADKVGARCVGEVVDIFDKPSDNPQYPDQKVFVLKQANGDLLNAPIKKTSEYLMRMTKNVQVGDTLGFHFEKEVPNRTNPKLNPAKSIVPYWRPKVGKEEGTEE